MTTTERSALRRWLPGLLALSALLCVYASTLQRDVNGSSHDYLVDVGEIQVALNLWGTIHYTGYPHFTILSALLTHLARALGATPAAAASSAALVWSMLALALAYLVIARLTDGERELAAAAVLALGLAETFWMHSVIAEVYSFSLLLVALGVWLALRLHERWQSRDWWCLCLTLGAGAAHHRLLLVMAPVALLLAGRGIWQWLRARPLRVLPSLLAALASFAAYIYLPLRRWQGSIWVYGQPETWRGFWQQFVGNEMAPVVLQAPAAPRDWWNNLGFVGGHLVRQLPAAVLLAGLLGLLLLARRRLAAGGAFLLGGAALAGFVWVFPRGVWAPATLMPALLFLMIGCAYALSRLAVRARAGRWMACGALLAAALWLYCANLPVVHELTRDPFGRQMIRRLAAVQADGNPGGPVVALPWDTGYFAAAYGAYVTGELEGLRLVDHRADFEAIVAAEGQVLTPGLFLHYWPPQWWRERLSDDIEFSAAAPGVVAIHEPGRYQDAPADTDFDLGNGVRIRSASIWWSADSTLRVRIFWEAMRAIEQDLSVAVHLVARVPPQSAADVLAQADTAHPVQGWYPTSRWPVGAVIRDEYELAVPAGSAPAAVLVSMYRVDGEGRFVNSEWLSLPILPR